MKRQVLLVVAALLFSSPLFAQWSVPEIPFDSAPDFLKLPDGIYMGEAAGVATNSKGHIFVYTRVGSVNATLGTNRTFVRTGSRLFEFDQNGKYVREIGQGLYGFLFAHSVRVDPQDNIWVVDEMANMVIKFDPDGRVVMTMGRKPEDIRVPAALPAPPPVMAAGGGPGGPGAAGRPAGAPPAEPAFGAGPNNGAGAPGDNFNRPTDVAWDAAGDIYVSDGYGNSRIAKYDKTGKYIKSWGTRGTGPGQFNTPHSIAVDAKGNVYVGDRENNRIQVFDGDGNFKAQYVNVGAPWAICITNGPHQYLYSSNSAPIDDPFAAGEIYKMELDGTILGKFGSGGKQLKEFGSTHEIDCRSENEMFVGELTNWRVQKLTLHPKTQVSQK